MEQIKTCLSVLGTCALFTTLPGTLELLLVTIGASRKGRRTPADRPANLRLAIVIPAHDEAVLIQRCVESVSRSAGHAGNCEIVVVADNCSDETAGLAKEAGARVMIRENAVLRGKGYALRLAFDQLQAEGFDGFLVVDADSIVSPNLVAKTKEHLAAGSPAVQCRYRISNRTTSVRTRLMDLAFLAFNVLRPKGRSGWGLSAGILGNGFAVSSATLKKVPWDAASIVEDLEYHLRLITAGGRVDFVNDATVFGETPAGGGAARVQRSRWEGGRMRMVREWAPGLTVNVLRGKWELTEPLLDLLTFPLAYHVLLLLLALVVLPGSFRTYPAVALVVVLVHVIRACFLGEQSLKTAMALAAAPFYMIWKITTLGAVLAASRSGAGWVRTGRETPTPSGQRNSALKKL